MEWYDLVSLPVDEVSRGVIIALEKLQHGTDGGDAFGINDCVSCENVGGLGGKARESVEHEREPITLFEKGQNKLGARIPRPNPAQAGRINLVDVVACNLSKNQRRHLRIGL